MQSLSLQLSLQKILQEAISNSTFFSIRPPPPPPPTISFPLYFFLCPCVYTGVCGCGVQGMQYKFLYYLLLQRFSYVHIFDLVKCGVLTLVGEMQIHRKGRYCYYYYDDYSSS